MNELTSNIISIILIIVILVVSRPLIQTIVALRKAKVATDPKKAAEYAAAAQWVLDEAGVTGVTLSIKIADFSSMGMYAGGKTIYINPERCGYSRSTILMVIAHEARHYAQKRQRMGLKASFIGQMAINFRLGGGKGYAAYFNSPIEVDANLASLRYAYAHGLGQYPGAKDLHQDFMEHGSAKSLEMLSNLEP